MNHIHRNIPGFMQFDSCSFSRAVHVVVNNRIRCWCFRAANRVRLAEICEGMMLLDSCGVAARVHCWAWAADGRDMYTVEAGPPRVIDSPSDGEFSSHYSNVVIAGGVPYWKEGGDETDVETSRCYLEGEVREGAVTVGPDGALTIFGGEAARPTKRARRA